MDLPAYTQPTAVTAVQCGWQSAGWHHRWCCRTTSRRSRWNSLLRRCTCHRRHSRHHGM